ncbi:MAG TPA: phosphatase PAP2 family protein [Bacteroidia bacterium]|jgi:undecaprenyl-diphosphatase|nr:phosphatase PAP2 family protein [Bacteroidia bacterium]
MEFLKHIDRELFLFLNGFHCSFCDAIMPYLTELWVWIPLFLWWLYLLCKKYGKKVLSIAILIAALIFTSDQGANLIKKSVKRYRPSHNIEIKDKVHIVDEKRGGEYGFISNHSSNVFALAFFLFFLLKPAKKIVYISLFTWAIFIGYTRIYLGVHYPLDIAGGAIWGFVIAFIFSKISLKVLA